MDEPAIAAFARLPEAEREAHIAGLEREGALDLCHDWRLWARPSQLPPECPWRIWLLLAGRGFGKTRSGAEFVREEAMRGARKRIALVAPTAADARDVMVEGESGLLAIAPVTERPLYEPSKRRLTWPNGAIATLFSADEPERLRGPQFDLAWCDELAAWRYPMAWDMLMMGLRLGDNPRVVATTTPKPVPLIRALLATPDCAVTRGSTRQVAQIAVASGASAITAANITDLRAVWSGGAASGVSWALTAGGADAITASYTPPTPNPLPDGLMLGFRALAANATSAPSFAPDGQTAHPITKKGGAALSAGDIPGALAECLLRYNLANTRWELLNPADPPPAAIPSGAVIPFAGSAAPSGWLFCFGQAISRTTFAALFAAIGTSFGAGDGSTTFNIPDLRGRAAFGLDNMGGTAAGRITSAGSGIAGTTLGATGGDEHMQAHGHSATVTDPGHAHGLQGYDPYSGGIHGGPRPAYTADAEASSPTNLAVGVNLADTGIGITVNSGGSGSSQNVPPALILNYVIKT